MTPLMITAVAEKASEYVVPEMVKGLLAASVWLPITNRDALSFIMIWEPMVSR